MKRAGKPREVAACYVYLACKDSACMPDKCCTRMRRDHQRACGSFEANTSCFRRGKERTWNGIKPISREPALRTHAGTGRAGENGAGCEYRTGVCDSETCRA